MSLTQNNEWPWIKTVLSEMPEKCEDLGGSFLIKSLQLKSQSKWPCPPEGPNTRMWPLGELYLIESLRNL